MHFPFPVQVLSVVGLLQDDVDPMVSVTKVEKAPLESYADIGGLDAQIQEIKEAVELPLLILSCMKTLVSSHPKESYSMARLEQGSHYLPRCVFLFLFFKICESYVVCHSYCLILFYCLGIGRLW